MNSPPLIETTLTPGNVLYMPRGFVHQARTLKSEPSFHATIAVATHDWTLARTIPDLMRRSLESIPQYRMAIPLELLRENVKVGHFQTEVDRILQIALTSINMTTIRQELTNRIHIHNSRAESLRIQFRDWWTHSDTQSSQQSDLSGTVGRTAARRLKWESSIIRAATLKERSFARTPLGCKTVGLTVREESREVLLSLLSYFNAHVNEQVPICNLRSLMSLERENFTICDLTLFCFVKCCVELGSLAIVL